MALSLGSAKVRIHFKSIICISHTDTYRLTNGKCVPIEECPTTTARPTTPPQATTPGVPETTPGGPKTTPAIPESTPGVSTARPSTAQPTGKFH